MAKTYRKEKLFQDFFRTAHETFTALEAQYGVTGLVAQIFGVGEDDEDAQLHLRRSRAWATLSSIYDYAIEGVVPTGFHPINIVLDGANVLKLASSETIWPSSDWDDVLAMADGRFALDDGQTIALYKLALLAGVDVRTVRNAVSSGDLTTFKTDDDVYVENASARRWVMGRRGFKPTVNDVGAEPIRLENVSGPADFGSFLVSQRKRLGLEANANKLLVFHSSVTPTALAQLEGGVFSLPLDTVFPIADFYQLNRKQFLDCVMRVFFHEELKMIAEAANHDEVSQ